MEVSAQKKKILAVVVGVLLILSLNFFQKEVKGFFYSISSPLQKTFWQTGDRVSDFFEAIRGVENLKKENEELRLKNQKLLAEVVSLKELKKENQSLREALEIDLKKDFQLSFAKIIGKNLDGDFVLINQGSKAGLAKGMPVITSQRVLLGKIWEVYQNFSEVMLISNPKSSLQAKIMDKEISGLLTGEGNFKISLNLIPRQAEIQKGDLVVTEDNLLIGLIEEVKKSDLKPFYQAKVSPFFDIEEIQNLFIIINYQ